MIINRKRGERLEIKTLPVGRQKAQTHLVMESNLVVAWNRVCKKDDPRFRDVLIGIYENGWCVKSTLTGDILALMKLVQSPKGRPRP